jgi:hypothetical protein
MSTPSSFYQTHARLPQKTTTITMQQTKKATQNRLQLYSLTEKATFKPLTSLNFTQQPSFEVISKNQRAQEIEPAKR